jgi:hypothetical protein
MLADLRVDELAAMRLEALVRAFLVLTIRREYPATSAARIAARRRVEAMAAAAHPGRLSLSTSYRITRVPR